MSKLSGTKVCPHCQNDDESLLEVTLEKKEFIVVFCNNCSKTFVVKK